jgi:hypothetical protein
MMGSYPNIPQKKLGEGGRENKNVEHTNESP